MTRADDPPATRQCASCASFRDDPAYLESALPGLASLSSAYGSTRGADGICLRHQRFAHPRGTCPDHSPRSPALTA